MFQLYGKLMKCVYLYLTVTLFFEILPAETKEISRKTGVNRLLANGCNEEGDDQASKKTDAGKIGQ